MFLVRNYTQLRLHYFITNEEWRVSRNLTMKSSYGATSVNSGLLQGSGHTGRQAGR